MKTRKHNSKLLLVLIPIAFLFVGGFLSLSYEKEPAQKIALGDVKREVVYPTQYSDLHITENAKVSEQKFRKITFFDSTDSLLANVISVIHKTEYNLQSDGEENGTWLWTPVLLITPKYRQEIISAAKKNGVKTIYLSIDSYLDIFVMSEGPEKEKKKREFDTVLEDFIKEASANDITVDAEAGWRNWAEVGHVYKAVAVLDYAIEYNRTHLNKLRGFQYDVEPYLLSEYKLDKDAVLGNLVNLVNQSVSRLNGSDLELSVVIPEFYDGSSGETGEFLYRGKKAYAIDHLLSVLERRSGSKIIIMSYRNWSVGDDGSIDISLDEIYTANKYKTKIVIAQETGETEPPYITFHNTSYSYYKKQVDLIKKAFEKEKSFGGTAVHYANSFIELK